MRLRYTVGRITLVLFVSLLSFAPSSVQAQDHSVAHEWNEVMLEAIRDDFARPTIHARNLYHTSVVMYDAWAVYDDQASPFFLGSTLGGFEVPFDCPTAPADVQAAQEEALSYAVFRLLVHRFQDSPGVGITMFRFNALMEGLGYDPDYTSTDYQNGTPADLGNYIAEQMIAYGLQDGANEAGGYSNLYYTPSNPDMDMSESGNATIVDPNRWQSLIIDGFVDQSGEEVPVPPFLSPEWGNVDPFALTEDQMTLYSRDGDDYKVWNDPGAPPYLDPDTPSDIEDHYKWGFALVSVWSGQLDQNDGVMWDVSPNAIGNIALEDLPTDIADFPAFYNLMDGGDISPGYDVNPVTGEPYEEQWVPRADYGRVLAEFWADGPDSETPPGHWYSIINYINYHPEVEKRWKGEGPILSDLEWDVKTYFGLGGAMHDAAVSAWSIKGWYDYLRPVSAIRYLADNGQSTDPMGTSYDPAGIPLIEGYIEVVESGDPLAGAFDEHLGKIKLYAWRGPDYIENPFIDQAGVDWILAENWWPYQRPNFVTPPFAGYISGHSTFSRAAAEVVTLMTGSPYFPGGMGVFDCEQNQFLVFEEGPSTNVQLQWASYRDASDQCSLSRIWGGIHPPADDIPGRLIGYEVGHQVFAKVDEYAAGMSPYITERAASNAVVADAQAGGEFSYSVTYSELMDQTTAPVLSFTNDDPSASLALTSEGWDNAFTYTWTYAVSDADMTQDGIHVKVNGAVNANGVAQKTGLFGNAFAIDTRNPAVSGGASPVTITDAEVGAASYMFTLSYDEAMNTEVHPTVSFPMEDASGVLTHNTEMSSWSDNMTYQAAFDVADGDADLAMVDLGSAMAQDAAGNVQVVDVQMDLIAIAQRNPEVSLTVASLALVTDASTLLTVNIDVTFDELMDSGVAPMLAFTGDDVSASLVWEEASSGWDVDNMTYHFVFTAQDANEALNAIDTEVSIGQDLDGNLNVVSLSEGLLVVDTENPVAIAQVASSAWVADVNTGAAGFGLDITFSEAMDTESIPAVTFPEGDLSATLTEDAGSWTDGTTYHVDYTVTDAGSEVEGIDVAVDGGTDASGNPSGAASFADAFSIDNLNPAVSVATANTYVVNGYYSGAEGFSLFVVFNEAMDVSSTVLVGFPVEDPIANGLTANAAASGWVNDVTYQAVYDVAAVFTNDYLLDINVELSGALDAHGNVMEVENLFDYFDMTNPALSVEDWTSAKLHVYPNPGVAGQDLNVVSNVSGQMTVELLDASGRLIHQESVLATQGQAFLVSTKTFGAGMYFLRTTNAQGSATLAVEIR